MLNRSARDDPPSVPGRRRLRLHQRAGMGEGRSSRLARRHEVVALQVSDPREDELPDVGSIYVEDAETGEQIFVDTSDPGFRARLRGRGRRTPGAPRGDHPLGRCRPAPGPDRRGPRPLRCCASPSCDGGGADEPHLAVGAARPARPPAWSWSHTGGCCGSRPSAGPTSPRQGLVVPTRPAGPVAARRAGAARRGPRRDAARPVPTGRGGRGAASRGHGHPRLRRLDQHGGQGHAADPARRGQGRGQGVRRASSRRP